MAVEIPQAPSDAITFAPLRIEHLDDLHDWLNRPHLRQFFQKSSISLSQVEAHYRPALRGDEPTRCHLAYYGGSPFAYLQCYRIADWPTWAFLVGSHEGIGVDLAITAPKMLGKGFGRAALSAYLGDIALPLFPRERQCFIAHELENRAAIACSRAVGFRHIRNFDEEGVRTALYVLQRDDLDTNRG